MKVKMQLSIVIPLYNEEKRIEKSLKELLRFLEEKKMAGVEIVLVNDGSKDSTLQIIEKYRSRINIVSYKPNKGKGHAIRQGVEAARCEKILVMDSDLATSLKEILKFIDLADEYDIVVGSRKLNKNMVNRTLFRSIISYGYHLVRDLLVPVGLQDTQCGFKMFKKFAAKDLFGRTRSSRWSLDIEMLFLARKFNYKIIETPVEWQEKGDSTVKIWKAAPGMLKDLITIRYNNIMGLYNEPVPKLRIQYSQELPNGKTLKTKL